MILIKRAKNYLLKNGKDLLVSLIISIVIPIVWMLLEIISVGKTEPSLADSVMYLILDASLLVNYLLMKDLKKVRGERECHHMIINVNVEKKHQ